MPIRSSVIVGCDTCEVEGVPDSTTIPKGWINFSHRAVDGGVTTYYFCSVACLQAKLPGVIEVRKNKLRRNSTAALSEPVEYDDWPEEWAAAIEEKALQIAMERQSRAQAMMLTPHNHDPGNPPVR